MLSPALTDALEKWELVIARLTTTSKLLTAHEGLLIAQVLLDTLSLCRDTREVRVVCEALREMMTATRTGKARQNGRLH